MRASTGGAAKQSAAPGAAARRRPGLARRAAVLVGGVAATAIAGYLVAALVIFPAPLLPNERAVPRVIGATSDEATRVLAQEGLKGEIADRERHPVLAEGLVTWQDPAPGVAVPRGSVVALTVSEGQPQLAVPDVHGLDAELAQHLLWAAGVTVGSVDSVASNLPAGVAVGTTPAARESLTAGGSVLLHLAKGTK